MKKTITYILIFSMIIYSTISLVGCNNSNNDENVSNKYNNILDEIIPTMIHVDSKPDFTFKNDITNSNIGDAYPIEEDYYICAYKVTNAQYKIYTDETQNKTPSYWHNNTYPKEKHDHPVLNISYSDVVKYCDWLTAKNDDWIFRLPTEAEWENAAYGTNYGNNFLKYPNSTTQPSYNNITKELTTTFNYNAVIASKLLNEYGESYQIKYIKGDFIDTKETLGECISINQNGGVNNWANHGGTAKKGYFLQTDLYSIVSSNGGYTTPVNAYPPNSIGLYDMAGNCWDLTSSIIVANNGLEKGISCYAVRGGSWYATARSCTISYRGEGRKDSASATVGFRIAAYKTKDTLA